MAFFKNTSISFETKNGDTVIGNEAYFQGTLTAKGSLRIDGRVDGSIVDAKIVTVGKSGKVKGDISCEICYVCGEVKGNITALDHIEALSGCRVDGDLLDDFLKRGELLARDAHPLAYFPFQRLADYD